MSEIIDVLPFCESDPDHWMHSPWLQDGKIVATDGRLLIVADPAVVRAAVNIGPWNEKRAIPNWKMVLNGIDAITEWSPLPEFPSCDKCHGTGRLVVKCSCFLGYAKCYACGHEHECEECDGSGKIETSCKDCGPEILGVEFFHDVASRVRSLPNVVVANSETEDCLFFRCDGATGAMMGRVNSDE